jgi:hypothetical protein
MKREELIKKARMAVSAWVAFTAADGELSLGMRDESEMTDDRVAARVVDAILPQVTTVEELEALPGATKLSVDRNGCPAMRLQRGGFVIGFSGSVEWDAETLLEFADGPLTVVWSPS